MNVFFAGVAVKNYQAACTWYERLLGRPPDMLPNEIEAAWRFSDTAWMYVIVDADRAGKAILTLIIDDLDQHVAALGERGFIAEETETSLASIVRLVFVIQMAIPSPLVRSSQGRANPQRGYSSCRTRHGRPAASCGRAGL